MSTPTFLADRPVLDVLLRDGVIARLRLLEGGDGPALSALHERVSLRTRMLRYFSQSERPGIWYVEKLMRSARGDCTLVASVDGQLVGMAGFCTLDDDPAVADLALLIDDDHQSEGLGALLLEHLAVQARHQGVATFVADVLTENAAMLHLLRDSGFAVRTSGSRGYSVVRVDLTEGPVLWKAVRGKDNEAQQASLQRVLSPRSVAVVGSTRAGSVAEGVWSGLNSGAGFVGTRIRLATHERLAAAVDLLVAVVPAGEVLALARDAARLGVKGLVVISAGFAETGPEGAGLQRELLELCRSSGIRLIGPNCLGVFNTDPRVRLNATFCDAHPREGSVALVSQSGAVGIAALRHAERAGVGLSVFVSTGNKADVSGNDLLVYLENDPRSAVIGLYLESFGNARKFAHLAAAVGRTKPIVVLKAGASEAGARAGLSHTAATATPELALAAVFREAGVLRADDLTEMFDLLGVLEAAPLPAGSRVVVLGNSGGPGVLAADACELAGLEVTPLSPELQGDLRALLPPAASVANPVDLLATVGPEAFAGALRRVLQDPTVDAVITIYTPLGQEAGELFAAEIAQAAGDFPATPVLACFPGLQGPPLSLLGGQGRLSVPFFEFPEPAARALGKIAAYAAWRTLPPPGAVVADAQRRAAGLALLGGEQGWLRPGLACALLTLYGIPVAATVAVADADAAVLAAGELGYPVVLKADGELIVHKTDIGGIALGLRTAAEVRSAYTLMRQRVGAAMTAGILQRMHPRGDALELLVGLTVDPDVGPLLLVGAGGTFTDLVADKVLRVPPGSREAASQQLAALRCAARLAGYRGAPPLAAEAVVDVMQAITAMSVELPEINELDLNPLLVDATGVCVLDARIRVGAGGPPFERGARSL